MRAVTRREVGVALLGLAALAACSGEAAGAGGPGLETPRKKEIAMRLVSSAENSSLDWRAQYRYIEDIGDGRGYTAGIIGFCSGTGDMLALVERYARERADAELAGFLPALREVRGSASHRGLGGRFTRAWQRAADGDRAFRDAQDGERDRVYFDPAVARGRQDGLGALGQFCYYDARVMHGHGDAPGNVGFATIRRRALDTALAGRRRDGVPARLPGRPGGRHRRGALAHRHLTDRHRPARLPPRGEPAPRPAPGVEGVRGHVPDRGVRVRRGRRWARPTKSGPGGN